MRAIASTLGQVMEIEEDFLDINPFRRVRVYMDCLKPLRRFQYVRIKGGSTIKITLKYERLPHFCFLCGLLNHTEKDYSYVSEEDKEKGHGWGMDIRASPRKGVGKYKEEVSGMKLRKTLFVTKPEPNCSAKQGSYPCGPQDGLIGGTGIIDDNLGVVVMTPASVGLLDPSREGCAKVDRLGVGAVRDSLVETIPTTFKEEVLVKHSAQDPVGYDETPNDDQGVVQNVVTLGYEGLGGATGISFNVAASTSSSRKIVKLNAKMLVERGVRIMLMMEKLDNRGF